MRWLLFEAIHCTETPRLEVYSTRLEQRSVFGIVIGIGMGNRTDVESDHCYEKAIDRSPLSFLSDTVPIQE
ncbi:MAG: hypothetical protein GY847_28540 [Proteobacteria bacterium]|nr:hypothetical protein [Pseudomonadota bacterium]